LPDAAEGGIKNTNLYNDKELIDDADLGWYDYGFRSYDAQIGRFVQIDPLADNYPDLSPYQYAGNEPIGNIDFMGLGIETGLTAGTAKMLEGVIVGGGKALGKTAASFTSSLARAVFTGANQAGRLALIAARGVSDALYNANTIGLYDAFGGNHLDEYTDPYEQQAYLKGRQSGDILAIAQGAIEVKAGASIAITTGIETAGIGAAGGAVVGLHGTGVSATAVSDLAWCVKKLYQLNISSTAAGDVGKSTNKGGSEPNRIGQQGEAASKGGRSGFKEKYTGESGKDRISDFSTKTTIEETKNVKYQYWSTQLKDAAARAKETGKTFILWIRKSTKISEQVKVQRRAGNVVIKFIPGSK
jgi:RHS repeat-associated protein